jgi:hypothetical protein
MGIRATTLRERSQRPHGKDERCTIPGRVFRLPCRKDEAPE